MSREEEDGGFDGTRNAHRWGYGQAWWRAGRAQLHSQYSWRCHGVWPGRNSWYWMAREQAWSPTEHPSPAPCPSPFVTTHSDNVPSVVNEDAGIFAVGI